MKNKFEHKVSILIAFVTLLVLVVGATYAYFGVNATSEFGTSSINATADSIGSVALTETGAELNMSLTLPEMMQKTNNVTYYASSTGTKTTPNTETIGTSSVTGTGYYICNYTLNVTNANASSDKNMYNAFQDWKENGYSDSFGINIPASEATEGQIILTIDGKDYDFYTDNLFPITYTGHTERINTTSPGKITASLKVVNNNNIRQNAIIGTSINILIDVTEFNCTSVEAPDSLKIIASSPNGLSENPLNDLLGENTLYRYQGDYNTVTNNYICFGTSDKNACTGNTEQYMYRILGIAEDGTMKLIKNEAMNSSGNTTKTWNSTSLEVDCTGDACEWPNSTLYNDLNSDYFLKNTSEYVPSGWPNKIINVDWNYGDIPTQNGYSADTSFTRENAWTDTVNAKIGLMYIYDYYYANGWDETQNYAEEGETPVRYGTDGWIHRSHSDGNKPNDWEWLLSRYGLASSGYYDAWIVCPDGHVTLTRLSDTFSVRPVFYLSNNVSITNVSDTTAGSSANPYIIGS